MFKLEKDYEGNGFKISEGTYSKKELISIYGTEERFNYCLDCTSLKEVLTPISEKMDKTPRLVKAFVGGFKNKSENKDLVESTNIQKETKEEINTEVKNEDLTLEEYKKIANDKGIPYHHKAGINKLKQLIKDSEKQFSVPTAD